MWRVSERVELGCDLDCHSGRGLDACLGFDRDGDLDGGWAG